MKFEEFMSAIDYCARGILCGCNKCPLYPAEYDTLCTAIRQLLEEKDAESVKIICEAVRKLE